jgi:hypothetical protein
MRQRIRSHLTYANVMVTILAFIVLGGMSYAATGDNFILGQSNSAGAPTVLSSPTTNSNGALKVANTSTTTPGRGITALGGHGGFGLWASGGDASKNKAAIHGESSAGNAVEGISGKNIASGVYGQNNSGGGYGVAGRAGSSGYGVYGDNTGGGFAGYFTGKVFAGGDLVCGGCVSAGDIGGKVNDSDNLDGIDSTGFVQGGGRAVGQAIAEAPGDHFFLGVPMAGFIRLSYQCPNTLTNFGYFNVYNDSGGPANVFLDSGGGNPTYLQMAAGGHQQFPAAASGDSYFIQAQGGPGIETIEAATVNRSSDCHAQAQALLTN